MSSNKSPASKTVISNDGLRYKAKGTGSPFGAAGNLTNRGATMSCFKCGSHRRPDEMETKRLIGKLHKVCLGGCKKD